MENFDFQGELGNVSQAINSGTFDPVGINYTSFDARLPSPTALPAVGGSASSSGGNTIASAAAGAGITGGTITPSGTTGDASGASTTPGTSVPGASAQNWFARGAIVILGFVFVAVGLSQFGIVKRV